MASSSETDGPSVAPQTEVDKFPVSVFSGFLPSLLGVYFLSVKGRVQRQPL